ncbi:HAMP domain-containing sensor histidine kinase [Sphingomonas sp. LR60]|uniref:sensor histidine kinase n=1 Tax=Sphingomonas sp. LR60 TaxID=3050233 RepID=UPI002FE2769C
MAFEGRSFTTIASGLGLAIGGGLLVLAWQAGLWASTAGALLVVMWIVAASGWAAMHRPPAKDAIPAEPLDPLSVRLLLDQIPVPLVRVDAGDARAINRAARTLFATDERILPVPPALADPTARTLRHESRGLRIDAVEGRRGDRLLALIDVEAEERAAQDRAADEMIDILGHELLNGLSPIVSLADSAITAAAAGHPSLPEILATLARRIEGLEAFTRGYRDLARLPAPVRGPVSLPEFGDDLARLFAVRFGPEVTLTCAISDAATADVDRDQLTQAVWALLQNGAEAAGKDGSVTLSITHTPTALTILVGDSGAGVAPDARTRIFRPFHTSKPDGSGIGLTIARRIARAHGGDVTLDDDRTTRFKLTALPCCD